MKILLVLLFTSQILCLWSTRMVVDALKTFDVSPSFFAAVHILWAICGVVILGLIYMLGRYDGENFHEPAGTSSDQGQH